MQKFANNSIRFFERFLEESHGARVRGASKRDGEGSAEDTGSDN